MNLDELCSPYGNWKHINLALSHWRRTHSPLVHWLHQMQYGPQSGQNRQRISKRLLKLSKSAIAEKFIYGLPMTEALRVCREMFSKSIAKLTIEFADANVMEIRKDIKTTFSDMLSAIGSYFQFFPDPSNTH